jgi:hypothetical protein
MADVLLHPFRRTSGTHFLPEGLGIRYRLLPPERAQRILKKVSSDLHWSEPYAVLCHCFSSFLFLCRNRTGINSLKCHGPFPHRTGVSFFPDIISLRRYSGSHFHDIERTTVYQVNGVGRNIYPVFLHRIFAGCGICNKFLSEEKNEVYTDNLSVLRNRVFI